MVRQAKSGTKKKKRKATRRPQSDTPIPGSTGVMGSMVGGLKAAVGAGGGDKKKSGVLGNLLWLLLLAAAAGFLFYRYNQ